jgi:c-di-GMP-binding flagellar brake protein YcgR
VNLSDGMRRRAPRLPMDVEAALSGRTTRSVRLMDLSLTGCLVRCPDRLDPGAILDLRLSLDGADFTAKVRVAEASLEGASPTADSPSYLAGLEFLGLAAREETELRLFLDTRRRRCAPDR